MKYRYQIPCSGMFVFPDNISSILNDDMIVSNPYSCETAAKFPE